VAAVIAPYVASAAELRARKLGVRATADITEAYDHESPLGNLFADLQRAVRPATDAGIGTGGGLRQKLPAGELTYGQYFESYPFDNFVATVRLKGAELRKMFKINLGRDRGILTISGLRMKARCQGDELVVSLVREDGREVGDDEDVVIVTSDYMAGGFEGARDSKAGVTIEEGVYLREEMIDALERRGPTVDPKDPAIYDPAHPRLEYPGRRPVKCPVAAGAANPS
jgi:2',3'-cyclic-nucleotide 2'-phosphodiesterase (5'-nucleotidase family)